MSFEGYYERICNNGHYTTHSLDEDPSKCEYCGAEFDKDNIRLVDITNGCEPDTGVGIPTPKEMYAPLVIFNLDSHLNQLRELVKDEEVADHLIGLIKKGVEPKVIEPARYRFIS